jgi:putative addiction module killer protein
MFGAGYRIYFGRTGDTIVVLICGGDKSTQARDIEEAISLWERYTQSR